ncbi:unnamed protein product [Euphydryas editha]|uniref:Uncharacterized protein n=1 Tax=Euphydryas editha TaxID=104508 RepID=A0AAU9U7Y0_EUPED|nr:unnamed protein product [Euphydryas editha]
MLSGLNEASGRVGLGMNLDKSNVMLNSHVISSLIIVEGITLEVVHEYVVYLGQIIRLGKNSFERAIGGSSWAGQHLENYQWTDLG